MRIPALDGLRGCAVAAVLLLHLTSTQGPLDDGAARVVQRLFSAGWAGVDLFFVLSGFLITGILADARGTPHRYRTFYLRRARRILPLYYGFLFLVFAVPALAGAAPYATPLRDQLPYWLYVQNFAPGSGGALAFTAHLWSLAIEEQFYLAWPLVVFTLSRRGALGACAACVLGALALRVASVLTLDDLRTVYFATPARIDGLALGGAVALLLRAPGGAARLRRAAVPALAAAAAVLAGAALHPSGFDPGGAYMMAAGYSALALFFTALLVLALDGSAPLARALSAAPLRFLGRYSYGLYVLHLPLIALAALAGIGPAALGGGLAGLAAFAALLGGASLAAAMASWHLWEARFLRA